MRKFLYIFLCVVIVFSLASCGGKTVTSYIYVEDYTSEDFYEEYENSGSLDNTSSVVPSDMNQSVSSNVKQNKIFLTISGIPVEDCQVVCDLNDDVIKNAANRLISAVKEATGITLKATTGNELSRGFFLVNESAAVNFLASSYQIKCDGGDVFFISENSSGVLASVEYFCSLLENSSTDFNIFDGYDYSSDIAYNRIDYSEPKIKYIGRWQEGNKKIHTTWNYAYLEVTFEGSYIAFDVSSTADFILTTVDGKQETKTKHKGNFLEFSFSSNEKHTVKLAGRYDSQIEFSKVFLHKDAKLFNTPVHKYNVQFIGDSISQYKSCYAFNAGDYLGWDYSVIAKGAVALCDGAGGYKMPEGVTKRYGFESLYFKNEFPTVAKTFTDHDFKYGIAPDAIVIFLGTNDRFEGEMNIQHFTKTYINFISNIKKIYPNTKFYVLYCLTNKKLREQGFYTAHKDIAKAHPDVTLIRSDKFNIEISKDGTHPTEKGYKQLGKKVADFLLRDFS